MNGRRERGIFVSGRRRIEEREVSEITKILQIPSPRTVALVKAPGGGRQGKIRAEDSSIITYGGTIRALNRQIRSVLYVPYCTYCRVMHR